MMETVHNDDDNAAADDDADVVAAHDDAFLSTRLPIWRQNI